MSKFLHRLHQPVNYKFFSKNLFVAVVSAVACFSLLLSSVSVLAVSIASQTSLKPMAQEAVVAQGSSLSDDVSYTFYGNDAVSATAVAVPVSNDVSFTFTTLQKKGHGSAIADLSSAQDFMHYAVRTVSMNIPSQEKYPSLAGQVVDTTYSFFSDK